MLFLEDFPYEFSTVSGSMRIKEKKVLRGSAIDVASLPTGIYIVSVLTDIRDNQFLYNTEVAINIHYVMQRKRMYGEVMAI